MREAVCRSFATGLRFNAIILAAHIRRDHRAELKALGFALGAAAKLVVKMKPASARRISSHADGPDVARARGHPATSEAYIFLRDNEIANSHRDSPQCAGRKLGKFPLHPFGRRGWGDVRPFE